jgi:small-conductance mechanosensitive channel
MTLLRLLFLLPLLLCAAPAAAQTAPPAANPPPNLTPDQARQALEVLQDPARRAQAIAVLEALAKAGAATPSPAAPASTAPKPAQSAPGTSLAPDSLGAQILVDASTWLAAVSSQSVVTVRSVTKLPALWRFVASTAADPWSQRVLLDAAWKFAVVAVAAVAAQLLAQALLRRPMRALARHAEALRLRFAPADEVPPEERGLDEAERGQTERHWRHLPHAVLLLRRLPSVGARLLLELLPVAATLATAYAILGAGLATETLTRLVILAFLHAYVLARIVTSIARALVGPAEPRLLPATEATASFTLRWLRRISGVAFFGYALAQVGLLLGLYYGAYEALLKLVGLIVCAMLIIVVLRRRAPVARWIRARDDATGGMAALRNRLARVWHLLAIVYLVALWIVWALQVQDGFSRLLRISVATALILALARFAALTAISALARATTVPPHLAERYPSLEDRIHTYHPLLRAGVHIVIGAIALVVLFEAWGIDSLAWFEGGHLGARVASALVIIAVTLGLALLVWESTNAAVERYLNRLTRESQPARAARLRTLLPMLRTTLLVALCLLAGLMILSEIGVNIAPLLAGAGVVGIAVGFGSQKLVQDVITGMFLLMENTMQVGDSVTLASLTGTIEKLSVRTIRLRALDGSVHIVPFSSVTTVTNMTRDYGYAVLDVEVSVNEDPERVCDVVREVGREMRGEEHWQLAIRDDIEVMGIDRFLATTYVVRARMRTTPSQRWAVQREFNLRIKQRFDEREIESPMTSYKALHRAPPADAPAGAGS